MAWGNGHVKSMIVSCFLWSIILLSPCAAQRVMCSNEATIVVNTTGASLVTDRDVPLHNPNECVLFEISPSDTTGLVAVEILEIFDNPPDTRVVAILYPSSQNRLYINALISNTTLLFYIPAGDSPALELQIVASGSSADYGFRARISLANETDCGGNYQCQPNTYVTYTACIRQESVCDGVPHCTDGNDEKNCEWCGETSYDLEVGQTATISNPNHNSAYVCSWQFNAPPLSRLLVRFTDYVVPPYVVFITSLKEITNFQGYGPPGDEDLYIFNFLTANASVPRVQTVVDSTVHVYLLHAEHDENNFQNEFLRFQLEVSTFNETVSCASDEFLCDTGIQCVSNKTRCDGLPDCDDHSDEVGCNGCESDKFSCVTNSVETCHTKSQLCDSSRHCDNFQDEYDCVPSCGDFKINLTPNTTHRVSSPYAQNGYPTNVVCAWLISSPPGTRLVIKTVQILLDYHATLTVGEGALVDQSRILWRRQGGTAPLTTSSVGHEVWVTLEDVRTFWFVNNDGGYVPLKKPHFIIDVSVLESAETRCSGEDQVACNDGYQCVNASDLCDGVIHCSDYSDELSCGHCGDTFLPCDVSSASSLCVDKSDICNGRADCTNYTDEYLCSNICGSKRSIHLEDLPFGITSPPNGLPPPIDCFWIFTTSPQQRILFEVINQSIGERDMAVIGDGTEPGNSLTEIARFKYFVSPVSHLSNGSSMWLTLSATDLMTSYGSFSYQFSVYSDAGSCDETMFRCSSGVCLGKDLHCDGIDSCGDLSDEFGCPQCGNVSTVNATDNQTHVLQKSFQQDQANFPFGISCLWRVVASPGHRIKVEVQDFLTLPTNSLQFGDGKEISTDYIVASSFGTSSILSLTSKTDNMWIKFASLVSSDDRFTLEIKQFGPVECEEGDIVCPSGLACIHQDEVCDGRPQCPLRGDEYGCGRCEVDEYRCPGKRFTCLGKTDICNAKPDCPDVSDEINCHPCGKSDLLLNNETAPSLPFFAMYHPFCVWFITADTDSIVSFEFWRFELEKSLDTLIIGNGHDPSDQSTRVVKLHGHLPRVRVITTGHEAWIRVDIHPNENRNRYIEGEISQKPKGSTCMEEEFTCTDQTVGVVCLDMESTCDGEPICPDETDESICSECGVENIRVFKETVSLSSPGFPGVTPNSITCKWQIIPGSDQFLFARITTFAVEVDYDKVYFSVERDSPELAILSGLDISQRTFAWKGNLWITMETDRYANSAGFNMLIHHVENVTSDLCTDDEFHCGGGFCVTRDSLCNGFRDCPNYEDENECSDVFCPGSYKCDTFMETSSSATRQPVMTTELATTTTATTNMISSNVSSYLGRGVYDGFFISVVKRLGAGCIPLSYVCDGEDNCKGLDDETECDKKRCPEECECRYHGENLIVSCTNGWNDTTLSNVAVTTHTIHFSGSNITSTREGAFKKLSHLRVLSLSDSIKISEIPPRTFDGLSNLLWLDLSNTSLTELKGLAMEELSSLRGITIFDVPLERIRKNAFAGLGKLETLILVQNVNGMPRLQVDEGAFDGLVDLSVLYVDDHRLCCFFPATIECKTLEPEPPLFVCSELMPNLVLKISMWILGVSALIGNIFVMVWRCREDTDGRDSRIVQSLFVFNLAVSDSLMGVYMLIIAGADLRFGNRYFEVSSEWQASILCKVAGFLSIVASEASVFFLTVISIDRFICIVFPFSSRHIRAKSGRYIACSIWIGTIIVGLVPTILSLDPTSDAYGTSDVCIGLPLMTKVTSYETRQQTIDAGGLTEIRVGIPSPVGYRASWFFSIALFLGVNLLCFLVILICYICIFATARSSMRQVRRHKNQDDELRMAIKMAAIVMTDFICWTPVIVMGILSQSRIVEIPSETYAWVVVFILPINSSLNPYLYTISDLCSQQKQFNSSQKTVDLSLRKLRTNGNASKGSTERVV